MLVKQRANEMVELRCQGLTYREIGKRLGCTGSAVYQAVRRISRWKGTVSELDPTYRMWIENEAARLKADPADVARALIVDAIEDARSGK